AARRRRRRRAHAGRELRAAGVAAAGRGRRGLARHGRGNSVARAGTARADPLRRARGRRRAPRPAGGRARPLGRARSRRHGAGGVRRRRTVRCRRRRRSLRPGRPVLAIVGRHETLRGAMNEPDRVEAQAVRDAIALGGGRAELAGGAMCLFHPSVPIPELNRALPIGQVVDVGAVAAWFGGLAHSFAVPPGYLGLEEQLAAHGYTPGYGWMKFERNADPAPIVETDLRVEPTLDR